MQDWAMTDRFCLKSKIIAILLIIARNHGTKTSFHLVINSLALLFIVYNVVLYTLLLNV